MIRILCLIPAGQRLHDLTDAQQAGIAAVATQHVVPMPGTVASGGTEIVDGVLADNFDPAALGELGLGWSVIGLWQWDGVGELEELLPIDAAALLAHLPDVEEVDEQGEVVATHPPVLHVPHEWAGWPPVPLPG